MTETPTPVPDGWRTIAAAPLPAGDYVNVWRPPSGVVDRLAGRRAELVQQVDDVCATAKAEGREELTAAEAEVVQRCLASARRLGRAPAWNSSTAVRSSDGERVATPCEAVIVQERGGEIRAVFAATLHDGSVVPAGQGLGQGSYVGTVGRTEGEVACLNDGQVTP